MSGPVPGLLQGWRSQPWSLRILRAWLGVTFVYAGINKLADPGFLTAGSPTYIGTQLQGFAQGSPLAPLLNFVAKFPTLTGLGMAGTEILVGLATLLGVLPRLAALGGLGLSITLWLSTTWQIHPYFLGSDTIYAIAWTTYLVALVEQHKHSPAPGAQPEEAGVKRRAVLRGAVLGGVALVTGGLATRFRGNVPTTNPVAAGSGSGGGGGASGGTGGGGTGGASATITSLEDLAVGKAVNFRDPAQGPSVAIRLNQDEVVAFSRRCTHAGCLVNYDPREKVMACPCHGSRFDPAQGAAVLDGPAPSPLPEIPVQVEAGGNVTLSS